MDIQYIDRQINDILNGKRDLPQFNQPEHAGVCSAGPLLVGALIVCHNTRESLGTGSDAASGQGRPSNWQIDGAQEKAVQQWAETKGSRLATKHEIDSMVAVKGFTENGDGNGINYISDRLNLEDMHPANVFVEPLTGKPICIDCIVKFRRDN